MSQSNQPRPDPAKAITLKPGQQYLGHKPKSKTTPTTGQWQLHVGSQAIDAWGVAIRVMREQGCVWE